MAQNVALSTPTPTSLLLTWDDLRYEAGVFSPCVFQSWSSVGWDRPTARISARIPRSAWLTAVLERCSSPAWLVFLKRRLPAQRPQRLGASESTPPRWPGAKATP